MISTEFQTPMWVADLMVNELPESKIILEPTPGLGNLVTATKNIFPDVEIVTPENDFFELSVRKVDAVIANPPFTPMKLGYDILYRLFEFSGNIVVLMPWLTLINSQKRTEKLTNQGLCKIMHLPRKAFPGSRVQCCVMVFKEGFCGDIVWQAI